MALQRVCVRCGQAPAHRVEASLALWNVAEEDQPTGILLADDACQQHQAEVITVLQEHCVEMLREQAPIHQQLVKLGKERDSLQQQANEQDRLVRLDAEQAEAKAAEFNSSPARGTAAAAQADHYRSPEVIARLANLTAAARDKEAERLKKLEEGVLLSDKRHNLMRAQLANGKKKKA
jgi:hypothetical protein